MEENDEIKIEKYYRKALERLKEKELIVKDSHLAAFMGFEYADQMI